MEGRPLYHGAGRTTIKTLRPEEYNLRQKKDTQGPTRTIVLRYCKTAFPAPARRISRFPRFEIAAKRRPDVRQTD